MSPRSIFRWFRSWSFGTRGLTRRPDRYHRSRLYSSLSQRSATLSAPARCSSTSPWRRRRASACCRQEKFVLDAGEARIHAPLDDEHRLGLVGVDDRHPVDGLDWSCRAAGLTTSLAPMIGHVRLRHLAVDLVHFDRAGRRGCRPRPAARSCGRACGRRRDGWRISPVNALLGEGRTARAPGAGPGPRPCRSRG